MSANPKTNKKTTTNPTKYLHQYLEDWDILSAHPLRMHGANMPVPYGYTAPPSKGRQGYWTPWLDWFCVHLRYNTLTTDSIVRRFLFWRKYFKGCTYP